MADAQRSRFDALAARVAAGDTIREAAAALNVAERTAYRWAAEATFKDKVSELRSAMFAAAAGRLADGMGTAVAVLRRLAAADVRKLYHPDGRLKLPHEWDDDTAAAVVEVRAEDETTKGKNGKVVARVTKAKLSDKLRAAQLVVDLGLKVTELTNLEGRVADIEARLGRDPEERKP
jgi:hypothetical protein